MGASSVDRCSRTILRKSSNSTTPASERTHRENVAESERPTFLVLGEVTFELSDGRRHTQRSHDETKLIRRIDVALRRKQLKALPEIYRDHRSNHHQQQQREISSLTIDFFFFEVLRLEDRIIIIVSNMSFQRAMNHTYHRLTISKQSTRKSTSERRQKPCA